MEAIKETAKFQIAVDTDTELFNGESFIYVGLSVDYINKTYSIKPPRIYSETQCRLPIFIARAIEVAYQKAMDELYKQPHETTSKRF